MGSASLRQGPRVRAGASVRVTVKGSAPDGASPDGHTQPLSQPIAAI